MLNLPGTLLLVGCGKMGLALLHGWVAAGARPDLICVFDPQLEKDAIKVPVRVLDGLIQLTNPPDIVVFAVKPQILDRILPAYAQYKDSLFLSIAAGKERAFFKGYFGEKARIVRAMPNTPAAIGRGMTVLHRASDLSKNDAQVCGELMKAVGDVAWITDEDKMHAVTALSGGGPAYFFLLIEVLTNAGMKVGLPEDLAKDLARKTLEGAAELSRTLGEEPEKMRLSVTSPKGTTLEAVKILTQKDGGMQAIFDQAIAAATARSREIAKQHT